MSVLAGVLYVLGALGGVTILTAAVTAVRWWLAHRAVRVAAAVIVDGLVVYLAVTNQRQEAEFEGRITVARGGEGAPPALPWSLKWRHSDVPAQLIAHHGTALLQVVEARFMTLAQSRVSVHEPMTLRMVDPSGAVKTHENVSGKRTGMSVETSTRMSVA
jgi:hypothetical protein